MNLKIKCEAHSERYVHAFDNFGRIVCKIMDWPDDWEICNDAKVIDESKSEGVK